MMDSSSYDFFRMLESAQGEYLWTAFKYLAYVAPVLVPLLLLYLFIDFYLGYRRLQFLLSREYKLLEIKVPEEIDRSPAGMEIVLLSLLQTSLPTAYKALIMGEVRPWWSLELVSIAGEVHFFIWTDVKYADIIKHQIYAQYPGVEIYEVPDYVNFTEDDPTAIEMWGTYFKPIKTHSDKEPYADVLPLKTYIDYGLDKNPKPEMAVDPLASTLEYLGSMRRGEQLWIQILVQPLASEEWKAGTTMLKEENKVNAWRKRIDEYVKNIKKGEMLKYEKLVKDVNPDSEKAKDFVPMFAPLDPGVDDFIKQLKARQNKYPFECAIRGLYIAEKEYIRADSSIPGLIGCFRQFNNPSGQGLKLGFFTDVGDFEKNLASLIPSFERGNVRKRIAWKESLVEAFKLRSFFYPPYTHWQQGPMVLTTDELATLFHFPSSTTQTPTFKRIESKKAEPPANLPM